jgi:NPCBM/NEW2 domain
MRSCSKVFIAILLAGIVGKSALAQEPQVTLIPAEGARISGKLLAIDGKSLKVKTADGKEQVVKLASVALLKFGAVTAAKTASPGLYTVSGGMLPGTLKLTEKGQLVLSSDWCADIAVRASALRGIITGSGAGESKLHKAMSLQGRRKDRLVMPGDELMGVFEGFTAKGIKFKSALGSDEYGLDIVRALFFSEIKAFKRPGSMFCQIEAGGGLFSGLPVGLKDGLLVWKTLDGLNLLLKPAAIRSLSVVNGCTVFLSDLDPVKVEQTPFIEGLPFVWSWRKDQDVFRKPLKLGGVEFKRGLGVAASCRLVYKLKGDFKKFKARIGICDATAAGGKTSFAVIVDGKQVFSTGKKPMTRGEGPRMVEVSLTGARTIEILTGFGPDQSDRGDIGGWGQARLLR